MSDGDAAVSLVLFSGLALREALEDELLPEFRARTGVAVECRFDPTSVLVEQIHSGNVPDILIGVTTAVDKLVDEGLFAEESVTTIASSAVGIAVPIGTVVPKFESSAQFVDYLLAARSVAYSRSGASGIFFAGLLDRMGLTERINARATILEKGFTAEALLDGRADVAIQQMSELLAIRGVQVIDAFPADLQELTHFSAARALESKRLEGADRLLAFLTTQRSGEAFRETGLLVDD